MLDYFVFAFLAEKFTEFAIQHVIYVIIASGLTGYVIFSVFLAQTRRRALNLGISGGMFAVSVVMLVASLALPRAAVDAVGLVSICALVLSNCSLLQAARVVRVRILLPVLGRTVPVERARLHDGSAYILHQLEQLGHPVPGAFDGLLGIALLDVLAALQSAGTRRQLLLARNPQPNTQELVPAVLRM